MRQSFLNGEKAERTYLSTGLLLVLVLVMVIPGQYVSSASENPTSVHTVSAPQSPSLPQLSGSSTQSSSVGVATQSVGPHHTLPASSVPVTTPLAKSISRPEVQTPKTQAGEEAAVEPTEGRPVAPAPPQIQSVSPTGCGAHVATPTPACAQPSAQSTPLPLTPIPSSASAPVWEPGSFAGYIPVAYANGSYAAAYDSSNGYIYVTNYTSDLVAVVNTATNGLIGEITVGSNPAGVAFDPDDGYIWVANHGSATVTVINGATDKVVTNVAVGGGPTGIAYDPGNGEVYVSCFSAGHVYIINPATYATVTVAVTSPAGIAVDSQNGYIYVASDLAGNDLVALNPTTNGATLINGLPAGSDPFAVAYDSDTNYIYVTFYHTGAVGYFSGATNAYVGDLTVGTNPGGAVFDAGNGDVYISNYGSATVSAISADTQEVSGSVSVGTDPIGMAYDGANGDVYTTSNNTNELNVISTLLMVGSAGSTLRGNGASGGPDGVRLLSGTSDNEWVTYDPVNGEVYLSTLGNGAAYSNVTVFGGSNQTEVANIPVGQDAFGSAYDSENGMLYVAEDNVGKVGVISTATNSLVGTISVGTAATEPYDVAFDSQNGYLYVADEDSVTPEASVINGATNALVTTITGFPSALAGVTFDSANGDLYFSALAADTVTVVSGTTDSIVSEISVGTDPYNAAYDSGNGDIYVADFASNQISVINGVTDTVSSTISGGLILEPEGMAYDTSNGYVYVGDRSSSDCLVPINTATNTPLECFAIGEIESLAYDSGNGDMYVVTASSSAPFAAVGELGTQTTPVSAAMDAGQSLLISAPIVGIGTGDLTSSISWTPSSGLSCSEDPLGWNEMSGACVGATTGQYTVTLTLTDSMGNSVDTSITLTVISDPQVTSPASSLPSLDVEQTTVLSTTASGGSGDYTYTWTSLPSGCISSDLNSFRCTPTGTGNAYVNVTVVDSYGYSVEPAWTLVVVDPDPAITISYVSRYSLDIGQSSTLDATVLNVGSGSVGSDVFSWAGLPGGCPSARSLTILCAPTQAGTFSVTVWIEDTNGENVSSVAVTIQVYVEMYGIGLGGTPNPIDVGQTQRYSASISGGTGEYSYAWTDLPAGCTPVNSPDLNCTPTAPGSPHVTVYVNDSNGESATTFIVPTIYADPAVTISSVSRYGLDVNQVTTLTGTASSPGSGTPAYFWSGLPGCPSVNSLSLSCTAKASGIYTVKLWIKDSDGFNASSSSITLVVYSAMGSASISTTSTTLDVGQTIKLSATASGGTEVYSYAWSGLPTGCVTADSSQLSCTPSSSGPTTVDLTVTDSNGAMASAAGVLITVSPDPTLENLTATNLSIDVGGSTTVSVTPTQGSGSPVYYWSGLPGGCASAQSSTLVCDPTATGHFSVYVSINDSNGFNVSSGPLELVVYSQLGSAGISATASSLDVGQVTQLTATISGGTGFYTYSWSGLPAGCAAANSAQLTCTPSASGPYTVDLTVSDSTGATSVATAKITVSADPTVTITSITHPNLDIGQTTGLTATTTTGSGSPTYFWEGLPGGCSSANSNTLSCKPSASGTFTVILTERDSNKMNVSSAPVTIVVSPALTTPAVSSTTFALDVGQTTILTASIGGGSGGDSYFWTGLGDGCLTADSATLGCTPTSSTTSTLGVGVTVTDSNGGSASSTTVSIVVSPDPAISLSTVSNSSMDVGESTTLTAVLTSGGSGNSLTDVFSWLGLPTGCPSANALKVTCVPSAAGTYTVIAYARDTNGFNTSSASTTLVVSQKLVVSGITASLTAIDVGQATTLSISVSGGSGGLFYTWGGLPAGCSSVDAQSVVCVPTAPVSFIASASVKDSNGAIATSGDQGVNVTSDPTVSAPSASQSSADVGQQVTFSVVGSASLSRHSLGYVWSGLPTGCAGSGASVSCTPTASGSFTISVTVTDANGYSVESAGTTFVVSSAPSASVGGSRDALDVGQSLTLTATITGGSGNPSYVWSNLPTGCSTADSAVIFCAPASSGAFNSTVSITDSNGGKSSSTPFTLTVSPALSISSLNSSSSTYTLESGKSLSITVTPSSGGKLNYSWLGLPVGCTAQDSARLSCSPTAAGVYSISVVVTDANGETVHSSGITVEVFDALNGAVVSASVTSLSTGGLVVFTATVSGGAQPLSFSWGDLPTGCSSSDSSVLSCSPTGGGTFTPSVTIEDADGATVTASSPAVKVTTPASPGFASGANGLDWTALILGLLALIMGLIAVALAMRRRDQPSQRTSSQPAYATAEQPSAPQSTGSSPAAPEMPVVVSTPATPESGEVKKEEYDEDTL